jgi:hypothetical protein
MSSGLLAPLSPQEEIALRRIAHGSFVVDAKPTSRLIDLALVQRAGSGLRLTPLGRLRFNSLPKAPLLGQQRSIHAVTGYVEGLIDKAQSRAAKQAAPRGPAPAPSTPRPDASPAAQEVGEALDELHPYQAIYVFFDSEQLKAHIESKMTRMRQSLIEHRHRHVSRCEESHQRVQSSLALLKKSVPIRPKWLADAK